MRWQPIETAPKDGTDILVFSRSRGVAVYAVASFGWDEDSGPVWFDGERAFRSPTHWMPLPELPS